MARADQGILATSQRGMLLLALRAGAMTSEQIGDRFASRCTYLYPLVRAGLVAGDDHGWSLTEAGRAACPLRNPLAAINPAQPRQQTGVTTMKKEKVQKGPTAIDRVRMLLAESTQGIARKDIIRNTGLSLASVDNAIHNLVEAGEAVRSGYGVITATGDLLPARVPVGALQTAVNVFAKPVEAEPAAESAAKPAEAKAPDTTADTTNAAPASEIDFSVYDDGRLAIIDGDEILVLPPDATRRLGYFLGCFDQDSWPPRLDPKSAAHQATAAH